MSAQGRCLDLVLAGGPEVGFGHVMRGGAIAAEARHRGWSVRLHLAGDENAADRLAEASGCPEIRPWTAWPGSRPADLALLDIPGEKAPWLDRCERAGVPTVVLDDDRARDRARLTIGPSLHALPVESADHIAGPRYAVLSKAHLGTRRLPLEPRDELLLSLGGSDPHGVTLRVAPVVRRLLESSTIDGPGIATRHVVLGPGFREADAAAAQLSAAGWRVHRALSREAMAYRMSRARLAVAGFGTSLAELAWLGTPFVSITHHAADDRLARALEARGIGRHLGFARELVDASLESGLRQALEAPDWQRSSARLALSALDGGIGARRIVEKLEEITSSAELGRVPGVNTRGSHVPVS
ncbi:MAG: hypothetical protein ACX98W_15195 [bacterium]